MRMSGQILRIIDMTITLHSIHGFFQNVASSCIFSPIVEACFFLKETESIVQDDLSF